MTALTDINYAVIDFVLKCVKCSVGDSISRKVLQRFSVIEAFALAKKVAFKAVVQVERGGIRQACTKMIAIGIE